MNAVALRAGAAIFVVGLLFVWLIRPIGNPCPDVDKLPSGATGSSAPSFAPPLTRTCTYSTVDGTKARQRYVPVLDFLLLLFAATVVGGAIGLAGGGRGGPRPARPSKPRPAAEPEVPREVARERARQEREARRRG